MVARLDFSTLVEQEPARARDVLVEKFREHRTIAAVARELGVSAPTLKRWMRALARARCTVPKRVRAPRGWIPGRPRGSAIARNFRGKTGARKKKLAKRGD